MDLYLTAERKHFSDVLEKELSNNINLITVFTKSEAAKHMIDLAKNMKEMWINLITELLCMIKIF